MLTQDIKKHIDAARQILVGVVPNPMSQIEQITNALIYKFMDDMDQQAIKAGGEPSFFVKDIEKYAWTKVMDSRLGNQERMNLYSEALIKFSEAKQLPSLFRDIFKQAFLPYRDPEVLGLFLKEISFFDYTHSEELGNAYEYLLSIMSSQGDAGQFRTPRHIIDFIVDVVAPTKEDTILDPACGTAGFLISAYNYIKRQNEGLDPETGKMRQLTADERRKLVSNFEGYDVDPTMVRMSQVNMYLHKFTTPKIYNYNTLASEERWNDKFDLILANPPFMSPKGGIKPHNKFSIQANRAEVLFVDYIMNHLKPKGRAGIIVPEGVIFQSGKAYKELRKNLVNDGLFAVVSLPAGVFNPYSGVKTSILFFDNEVAKKTKDLLFVKVASDGYDLGAQRRKIEKNDLPDAGVLLKAFRVYVRNGEPKETIESFISESGKGFVVSKDKIAESDEYNLSVDRYKVVSNFSSSKYEKLKLGDICDVYQPKTITSQEITERGLYKVFGANGVIGFYDKYNHEDSEIAITCRGATCGTVNFTEPKSWITGNAMVVKPKDERVNKKFLYYVLRNTDLSSVITGAAQPQITGAALKPFEISVPPLDIQEEVVQQIEIKQKAIDGAKQVIDNLERERRYFGQLFRKQVTTKWVELGSICEITSSKRVFESEWRDSGVPFYRAREIVKLSEQNYIENELYISDDMYNEYSKKYGYPRENDLMVTGVGTLGACYQVKKTDKFYFKDGNIIWLKDFSDKIIPDFIRYLFGSDIIKNQIKASAIGGTVGTYTITNAKKTKIPLPSLEVQQQMIDKMNEQESIIIFNKKLVVIMKQKINEVLETL